MIRSMRRSLGFFSLIFGILSVDPATAAQSSRKDSGVSDHGGNVLFAYSHLAPSPLTIPGGQLLLGTAVTFGVTDFLQVSTDALRLFYGFMNANAKLKILDLDALAVALTLGFESVSAKTAYPLCGIDLQLTSVQPGIATAIELLPRLALFVSGNLNLATDSQTYTFFGDASGSAKGAQIETDLGWAYHPATRKRDISNVLAAGLSYDTTYKLLGMGLSHHWPGFQVGFHYYPAAANSKWRPILVGGMGLQL